MNTAIKITNENTYNEKVKSVYTDSLKSTDNNNGHYGSFLATGNITIITADGEQIDSTGEHGSHDFEEDFGFILITDGE